jgi:predicted nucleic acid-binding protein
VTDLVDAEVGQALRRFALRGEISDGRAQASLDYFANLPIRRFAHTALLSRAFAFRFNVTVYDGLYLALAEALDVPLVSCDTALQDVPGCMATVEILPAGSRTD